MDNQDDTIPMTLTEAQAELAALMDKHRALMDRAQHLGITSIFAMRTDGGIVDASNGGKRSRIIKMLAEIIFAAVPPDNDD